MRLGSRVQSWQIIAMQLRIRELRKKRRLTGEMLADKVGCSKSYISEIETGKKFPSGRLLQLLARELHVSIYELIDSEDVSQEIITHLEIMKSLSDEDRRAVSRHAASLLEKEPQS